jgi:two-component system phosphate regulon sensor histidine kinase PhoR
LAGIIYDENVRLGNHIERVLNIAKIDKEDVKLDRFPQQVNDLISAVVDSMELQLHKKNTQISLHLGAQKSTVIGDELHLSNVIYNLVDNANKYSNDSSKISITTLNEHNNLIVKIKDNGIGMSKEQLNKIFDQFYRIPTGNLHDVKGFGLGLSYVHSIVKKMKGTISVKSEKDKGSEFEIKFPLA